MAKKAKAYTLEELEEMAREKRGNLYLVGTGITSLPEGLTVGGSLDLGGCTGITGRYIYKKLKQGDCVPDKYVYADGILTHIKKARTFGQYTYFVGKIKGKNVITDGVNFAHCANFKEGVADLAFKAAKDRGAGQYKKYSLDSMVPAEEAIAMYRVITGACKAGTEQFLQGLGELKESYTIQEIIELTKGHYGASTFENFFS